MAEAADGVDAADGARPTVLTVVGARPQFIKAAPVSRALAAGGYDEVLVHTGQHYDDGLSGVFFDELDIPRPDYHLGVGSGSHGEQTGRMLSALGERIAAVDPEFVVVYGDTNSTLAGGIAASKLDTTLVHVEAGLRSGRREMPEEVNRLMTDHAADVLLAPTERAMESLAREGLSERAHRTGDVSADAVRWARERAPAVADVFADLGVDDPPAAGEFVLATVHRPRNTDDGARLRAIVKTLTDSPLPVVFPAHPRTTAALEEHGLLEALEESESVILVEPVGYLGFVRLMSAADRVLTDSGGVQKETFLLGTPCVTLREETEWPETVEAGWNVLVGADPEAMAAGLTGEVPEAPADSPSPYGDGDAASEIVEVLDGVRS
ncbi:non-hydrolyzing UDP-N-acetylglucosamine 2-epimerase [Candidatus Halobonum tyrrellensis]|uniref:UDP-N-acetylglucosamine 2-epimerase n=1 Tax=Candidatus Halobonum tyrrellensis G22 TaxID=1324957 RepID=V4H8A7_9EURY|nr:UDP-N-acetylglucosamine 2-epimerase (non-hydrolyzing) [Candidatus Halobonum tyrrellensis]ESP86915.1 UDP-N-acetylglucosamine 2-epimerase [Candidatus Halobonum tyrrellensis G22]